MFALDVNHPPPQPKSLAEAQQVIEVLWRALGEAVARIEKLEEQLNTDSTNSSQPPSSDSPKKRAERRKKPCSKRAQGAQPGHPKHERTLVAEAEVDEVQRFFPENRCDCGSPLWLEAEPAVRHQVFDLL